MKLFTKIFSPLIHHQANADALLLSEQLNRQLDFQKRRIKDHRLVVFHVEHLDSVLGSMGKTGQNGQTRKQGFFHDLLRLGRFSGTDGTARHDERLPVLVMQQHGFHTVKAFDNLALQHVARTALRLDFTVRQQNDFISELRGEIEIVQNH